MKRVKKKFRVGGLMEQEADRDNFQTPGPQALLIKKRSKR